MANPFLSVVMVKGDQKDLTWNRQQGFLLSSTNYRFQHYGVEGKGQPTTTFLRRKSSRQRALYQECRHLKETKHPFIPKEHHGTKIKLSVASVNTLYVLLTLSAYCSGMTQSISLSNLTLQSETGGTWNYTKTSISRNNYYQPALGLRIILNQELFEWLATDK